MRVRDHLIAATLALAVMALSLTIGQNPPRGDASPTPAAPAAAGR